MQAFLRKADAIGGGGSSGWHAWRFPSRGAVSAREVAVPSSVTVEAERVSQFGPTLQDFYRTPCPSRWQCTCVGMKILFMGVLIEMSERNTLISFLFMSWERSDVHTGPSDFYSCPSS